MHCKFNFILFAFMCVFISLNGAKDSEKNEKSDAGLTDKKNAVIVDTNNATETESATESEEQPSLKKLPFSWVTMPNDTFLKPHESAHIDCLAKVEGQMGAPPTYVWTTGGKNIPVKTANVSLDLDVYSFENGTLVIEDFSGDLSGAYSCNVKSVLKKTITIQLGEPVTFGELPEKATRFIGCNLTIECIASGDGAIKGSMHSGDDEKEVQTGGSREIQQIIEPHEYHLILHIYDAKAEDSSNYTCKFTSEFTPAPLKKSVYVAFTENTENKSCDGNRIVASSSRPEDNITTTKAESGDKLIIVYVLPLVIILSLVLIAITVSVAFVIRRRRLQQNAVFSGVKYRRTEGNEDGVHA